MASAWTVLGNIFFILHFMQVKFPLYHYIHSDHKAKEPQENYWLLGELRRTQVKPAAEEPHTQ